MIALHENALVDALKGHRDIPSKVRTVDTLPKVIDNDLLKRYLTDAPALYVVPGQLKVEDSNGVLEFIVVGIVANAAGHAQARKGDGVDIGCDHLLILAVRALNEQKLGQCTWSLASAQMANDEIFVQSGISAIEMKFVGSPIPLPYDYGEEQLQELDDFLRFHADIDLSPLAGNTEYASWFETPPDYSTSRPDAQLDVQLTGAT